MAGCNLATQGMNQEFIPEYYSVKEAVFPFTKFQDVDPLLSPEMKSTGEVMGVGRSFGEAFAKSQLAANVDLPRSGRVFISVRDSDKYKAVEIAKELALLKFDIVATRGTAQVLKQAGVACTAINKVVEGEPHIVGRIEKDEIDLIINTSEGKSAISDSYTIRRTALQHKVAYTTTITGAEATVQALKTLEAKDINRLQDLHKEVKGIKVL